MAQVALVVTHLVACLMSWFGLTFRKASLLFEWFAIGLVSELVTRIVNESRWFTRPTP